MLTLLSALLFACLESQVSSDCVGAISQIEYNVLEAIYNSTNGMSWELRPYETELNEWHFPARLEAPCGEDKWLGLICNTTSDSSYDSGEGSTESPCFVSAFQLEQRGMYGTIPGEVGKLSLLELLDFGKNSLFGSIPSQISGMVSLQLMNLQNNGFGGPFPSVLTTLPALQSLFLNVNRYTGSIPSEVGQMEAIFGMYLESNYFVSTIPTEIGKLTDMRELYLHSNDLTGLIPTELYELSRLWKLYIYDNYLTGPIPGANSLVELRMFLLQYNLLTGTLPISLGNMNNTVQLSVGGNMMSGSFPDSLCSLLNTEMLNLGENYFTGTIPNCVGNWVDLHKFEVNNNHFEGVIPDSLLSVSDLNVLFMENNMLSGSLSDAFYASTSLQYVYLTANRISGSISSNIVNMTELLNLVIDNSYLTGTLPPELFLMTQLRTLSIGGNLLSGPFYTSKMNCPVLEIVNLWSNYFTGTLPSSIGALSHLRGISIETNYFTGPFILAARNELGLDDVNVNNSMGVLESMEVGFNFLSGSIPNELKLYPHLQNLVFSSNFMDGTLEFLVDSLSLISNLEYLDISSNAFSGTIPGGIFEFPDIYGVVMFSNCFTGSLPATMCNSTSLTALVLDSVSSAPSCDIVFPSFFKNIFKIEIGKRHLTGSIPDCLWTSSPKLETLHLSGNGLKGTLTDVLLPTVRVVEGVNKTEYVLNDVSLASNALSGTIPASWQDWGWQSLDLSGNRITGTLNSDFQMGLSCKVVADDDKTRFDDVVHDDQKYGPQDDDDYAVATSCGHIDLTVNRLSGKLPTAFHNAPYIDVLDGNLFQCSESSMPNSDPAKGSYVCGSSDYNDSLILWGCACVFAAVGVYCLLRLKVVDLTAFFTAEMDTKCGVAADQTLRCFMRLLFHFCSFCLLLLVFYLSVCMVSYILLKTAPTQAYSYSTVTFQYAWVTTVAYLHGTVPGVLVIVYLLLSVFVAAWRLTVPSFNEDLTLSLREKVISSSSLAPSTPFANSSSHATCNPSALLFEPNDMGELTTSKSGCSYGWSVLRLLLLIFVHIVVMICINVLYVYVVIAGKLPSGGLLVVQLCLGLFKLSWNRFYVGFVLKGGGASVLIFSNSASLQCASFMIIFTFIASPIIANFFSDSSCFRYFLTGTPAVTSSFMTNVYDCLLYCEVACKNICRFFYTQEVVTTTVPSWLYSYQCSSSLLKNYAPVLMYSFVISGMILPLIIVFYLIVIETEWFWKTVEPRLPVWLKSQLCGGLYAYQLHSDDISQKLLKPNEHLKAPFKSAKVVSRLCMNIGVLMTFGLASPLLAIAVAIDSVNMFVIRKMLLIKYIGLHSSDSSNPSAANVLDQKIFLATRASTDGLGVVLWMVVAMSGIFWALFVFDMFGDVYGETDGLKLISIPIGGTLIIYGCTLMCVKQRRKLGINDYQGPIMDPQSMNESFDGHTL